MANKQLFAPAPAGAVPPVTDIFNHAGGNAFQSGPKESLAQYVATGCLGATFYTSAEEQLDTSLQLAASCSPEFVAQVAIYGRKSAFMKDTPALLLGHLLTRGDEGRAAFRAAFPRVIDNPKMLRTFVQILRSGKLGRKSVASSVVRKAVGTWFATRTGKQLFFASIGNDPSLKDVIKLARPKPVDGARDHLYRYLIDKEHDIALLPEIVQAFEAWKLDPSGPVPDVPFLMLTAQPLKKEQWKDIARNATWQTTRMNLATFNRHGVFEDPELMSLIAHRLVNPDEIKRARVFPYQLLMAFKHTDGVPRMISDALQDAMERATENVPVIDGPIAVFPDVSRSMDSPVTGGRGTATTKVTCRDVAALVAATFLRRNPDALVVPFKEQIVRLKLNARDSIMTIADQIAKCGSGGTNCSAPLKLVNAERRKLGLVIYVSDNESWVDAKGGGTSTEVMVQWEALRARNPGAKMVCIDVTPNRAKQAPTRRDILNVGGFSDEVFTLTAEFAKGSGQDHWVKRIESIDLSPAVAKAPEAVEEVASIE